MAGGVPRAVTLSEQSARSQRCALRGVDDTSYVPIWDRIVQTCFTDQLAGIVLGTVGRYPRCLVGRVGCRSAVVCSEEAESVVKRLVTRHNSSIDWTDVLTYTCGVSVRQEEFGEILSLGQSESLQSSEA